MTSPLPVPARLPPLFPAAAALTASSFPGPVYHYTDQRGFLGILKDKAIWASDLRYLNDAKEYAVGFDRILTELERYSAGNSPLEYLLSEALGKLTPSRAVGVNVTSFSLSADDLSQWRAYGGGSGGLCIGFDQHVLTKRILFTGSSIGGVRYSEEDQASLVSQLCAEMIDEAKNVLEGGVSKADFQTRCSLSVQLACALMKHHKFADEREWRMIVWSALPPYVTQHVRPGRSTLIPYVAVRLDAGPGPNGPQFNNKLPLSTTWVGPTPHPDLAMRGVWAALSSSSEYSDINMSTVPFRNW
jgi:hypothetical protein